MHRVRVLWKHIPRPRKIYFAYVLCLMICVTFLELVSIGAVLPFIGVMLDSTWLLNHNITRQIVDSLNLNQSNLVQIFTLIFCLVIIITVFARLLLLWLTAKIAYETGADLSAKIYLIALSQPYSVHLQRNSSEIISAVTGKINSVIYSTIMPSIQMISTGILVIAILTSLSIIYPREIFFVTVAIIVIYGTLVRVNKYKVSDNSKKIASNSTVLIKSIGEGLGGIRDVLLSGTQGIYVNAYKEADLRMRQAQGRTQFIAASPRYAIEAVAMLSAIAIVYHQYASGYDISAALPIMGALLFALQRLLPGVQLLYGSWTNLKGGQNSLLDILKLLESQRPIPSVHIQSCKRLEFNERLELLNVSFRYTPDHPYILDNINITIAKGSRIGIIGSTGSGKSTLLDIIMGLLSPTTGHLKVDGREVMLENNQAWQSNIAHVPQTIFLADASVAENIAFGIPAHEIDHSKVIEAAKLAQIADTVCGFPEGYATIVGERGARLSGGQKQRIGIARALYRSPDILILDEATSALDFATESKVMTSIEALDKKITIVLVAHRLSSLSFCNTILEVKNKNVAIRTKDTDILDLP